MIEEYRQIIIDSLEQEKAKTNWHTAIYIIMSLVMMGITIFILSFVFGEDVAELFHGVVPTMTILFCSLFFLGGYFYNNDIQDDIESIKRMNNEHVLGILARSRQNRE